VPPIVPDEVPERGARVREQLLSARERADEPVEAVEVAQEQTLEIGAEHGEALVAGLGRERAEEVVHDGRRDLGQEVRETELGQQRLQFTELRRPEVEDPGTEDARGRGCLGPAAVGHDLTAEAFEGDDAGERCGDRAGAGLLRDDRTARDRFEVTDALTRHGTGDRDSGSFARRDRRRGGGEIEHGVPCDGQGQTTSVRGGGEGVVGCAGWNGGEEQRRGSEASDHGTGASAHDGPPENVVCDVQERTLPTFPEATQVAVWPLWRTRVVLEHLRLIVPD
jgi:hypothetical protein